MLLSSDNLTNLKFVASLPGFAQSKAQHMATELFFFAIFRCNIIYFLLQQAEEYRI